MFQTIKTPPPIANPRSFRADAECHSLGSGLETNGRFAPADQMRVPKNVEVKRLFVRIETRRKMIDDFDQRGRLPVDILCGLNHEE